MQENDDVGFDWLLLTFWVVAMGFGLMMILSASSFDADQKYNDSLRFVIRQSAGVGVGVAVTAVLMATPRTMLRKLAWPLFLASLVGCALILTPLAHSANGATRWFRLGPVNVQPSEFLKIGLVLGLASHLSLNEGRLRDWAVLISSGAVLAIPIIAIIPQKDFGTTVILCGLGGVLLFVAGLRWLHLTVLGGVFTAVLAFLIAIEPYRMVRLMSFRNPHADAADSGYQVVQGWIALATGGAFGQGIASGAAQRGFLPEAHTDFISAVIGEELGAVGWLLMVLCFAGIVWRSVTIASHCTDLFGMLVAIGLTALIGAQAIINLGVVGGLVPNKGLVLPFFSYGASAALAHTLVIGILLRLSMDDAEPAPALAG